MLLPILTLQALLIVGPRAAAGATISANGTASASQTRASTLATTTQSSSLSSIASSSTAPITTSAPSSASAPVSTTPFSSLPAFTPPPLKPGQLPNSYPSNPNVTLPGSFDETWQDVFLVTQGLPNITFPLPRNFAGNLPVNRPDHANNTLFFWAMENNVGSLTATATQLPTVPWMIWLGGGGGPASSALLTSMVSNGPMLLNTQDLTISQNAQSLSNLLDVVWVDQPVGAGYSTVDSDGYAKDEDDVLNDFIQFLTNLAEIFPSLATRPLILAGEDYASIYIAYIAQVLATIQSPPVQIASVAMGNPMLGDISLYADLSTTSILQSMPQMINYDESVYSAFASKSHSCGYDFNLTYPQANAIPNLPPAPRRSPFWSTFRNESQEPGLVFRRSVPLQKRQSPSLGSELDPFYGCALFDEMIDYAANFSSSWAGTDSLDLFDLSNALSPKRTFDGGVYFNSLQVREALHAPFSKNWTSVGLYPFGSTLNTSSTANIFGDPTPMPTSLLNSLRESLSTKNASLILYSGTLNAIASHHALSIQIQNTTFGNTRGFTRQPSTPLVADSGATVGIVHTEHGVTFAMFDGIASLWRDDPGAAYGFFRDFVLARGTAGSLSSDGNGKVTVLGGEDAGAREDVPRVASDVFVGSMATQGTLAAPSATVAAWASFVDAQLPQVTSSSAVKPAVQWSMSVFPVIGAVMIAV
ncbi:alpha/beta-hydrolase [Peniophora sp. CONT]|nr:alpha/beta-hydrolase [Peniophora sp. CONT]